MRSRRPSAPLLLSTFAAVLVAGVTTLVTVPGAAVAAGSGCTVRTAAHRGSHDAMHTENTRRSARLAVARHAYAVEGDLQLTRDGVWMLMHDDTVDRTTDGTGLVSNLTSTQIKQMHTLDGVLGGVPSLDQLLTTMDEAPTTKLQLEIKPASVSNAAISSLLHTFAAHGVAGRLMITSFNRAPLAVVRSYSSSWNTALISTSAVSAASARPYGDKVIVEQSALNPTYVSQMRGAGFVVWAWTVDTESGWRAVKADGVNGVVTNKLLDTLAWCAAA